MLPQAQTKGLAVKLSDLKDSMQFQVEPSIPTEFMISLPKAPLMNSVDFDAKKLLTQGSLQLIPYNETVPPEKTTLRESVPHSDLSEIDALTANGERLFAAIPDRANPSRVHFYKSTKDSLLELSKVIPLLNSQGELYPEGSVDTEALRFYNCKGRTFAVVASEGPSIGYDAAKNSKTPEEALAINAKERSRSPQILLAELTFKNGHPEALQVIREIAYPAHYRHQVTVDQLDPRKTLDSFGTRANGSFESISVSPSGRVALITESPLTQDGPLPSISSGGICRFLTLNLSGDRAREFPYRLEKVPISNGAQELLEQGHLLVNQDNGVVSICNDPENPEQSYFVMERSFLRISNKDDPRSTIRAENSIRLYRVTLDDSATDVSGLERFERGKVIPLKKELVLDLDELAPIFSAKGVRPDNFEGFTISKDPQTDSWELILVSDNNSNKSQGATQILRLPLEERLAEPE